MLRLRDPQESLWDQLLPPQARTLSAELTAVDECLANDRFFEPYRQRFHTLIGRPTVPVETYLRLIYAALFVSLVGAPFWLAPMRDG